MDFTWKDFSILVVEDDPDMLQVLCEIFRKKGAQIFSAENGQNALGVIDSQRIDFVVSDVQMPVMDGVELLTQIRKKHPKIPIVLLATGQSQITAESAMSKGAAGLIHKPFNSKALLEQVEGLLVTIAAV